jgi:hypothetical protein
MVRHTFPSKSCRLLSGTNGSGFHSLTKRHQGKSQAVELLRLSKDLPHDWSEQRTGSTYVQAIVASEVEAFAERSALSRGCRELISPCGCASIQT